MSESLRIPDAVTPVRAFRSWLVGHRIRHPLFPMFVPLDPSLTKYEHIPDGMLGSVHINCVWPTDGPLHAICSSLHRFGLPSGMTDPCSETPNDTCSCGIYAHKSLHHIRQQYGDRHYSQAVVGVVELWGNLVECTRGWKASRARPIALAQPSNLAALILAKAASDAYKIPLVPMNNLPSYVDRGIYRGYA